MSKDEDVARLAERQHGLLTREQARRTGLNDRKITHRLASGRWRALRRGIFAIGGVPSTREQVIQAACLTCPGAVASHLTAAWLWGLELPSPVTIELTTTSSSRVRRAGIFQHRRPELLPADRARCRGIPVTSPARTRRRVRIGPARTLGRMVDGALCRKLVVLADLQASHARVDTGPGRRPTVALRAVLAERAKGYDPGGSDRELWVKRILEAAGLPSPVQQHRVRVGTRVYDLDLAYPAEMVGLEFDGWDAHGSFTAFHHGRERFDCSPCWAGRCWPSRRGPGDRPGAGRAPGPHALWAVQDRRGPEVTTNRGPGWPGRPWR